MDRAEISEIVEAFKAVGDNVDNGLRRAVERCCILVEKDVKDAMSNTPVGGFGYKRTKKGKFGGEGWHYASLPGFAPAKDAGFLATAITHRIEVQPNGMVNGFVGTGGKEGAILFWLEFGTEKMAPRPSLFPALEKNADKIEQMIDEAMEEWLNV